MIPSYIFVTFNIESIYSRLVMRIIVKVFSLRADRPSPSQHTTNVPHTVLLQGEVVCVGVLLGSVLSACLCLTPPGWVTSLASCRADDLRRSVNWCELWTETEITHIVVMIMRGSSGSDQHTLAFSVCLVNVLGGAFLCFFFFRWQMIIILVSLSSKYCRVIAMHVCTLHCWNEYSEIPTMTCK